MGVPLQLAALAGVLVFAFIAWGWPVAGFVACVSLFALGVELERTGS